MSQLSVELDPLTQSKKKTKTLISFTLQKMAHSEIFVLLTLVMQKH